MPLPSLCAYAASKAAVLRFTEELAEEMRQIRRQYRDEDEYYLFENHGQALQLVVYNQGDEPAYDLHDHTTGLVYS